MMKINDSQFSTLWSDALTAPDREAYISDWALSSIWGDDPESEIPQSLIDWLGHLWDVAHMSVREICQAAGLRQVDLRHRYIISSRPTEEWWAGRRAPTDHQRLMLAECLGLLSRSLDVGDKGH